MTDTARWQELLRLVLSAGFLLASAAPLVVEIADQPWPTPRTSGASNETAELMQRQDKQVGLGERHPTPSRIAQMTFIYPAQLRENQTGVVTLTYRLFTEAIESSFRAG